VVEIIARGTRTTVDRLEGTARHTKELIAVEQVAHIELADTAAEGLVASIGLEQQTIGLRGIATLPFSCSISSLSISEGVLLRKKNLCL
jgi:hypothetical protein